ncbi:MAG TPA: SdpI family protein [Cyclobacteriaceae bacterium]|nr:SdpI family protein [Cyclobacteriaceae bacterium]
MNRFIKEFLLWLLLALPYVYLLLVWSNLPDTVAIHFGLDGQPNGWASKTALLFIPLLGILSYLLMLILPRFDSNRRVEQMGGKYYSIRFIMGLFISLVLTYLVYLSNAGSAKDPSIVITLVGGMIALLGNYFQTLRPNYFMGIRTPWTLGNETVWRKTHKLSGLVWMVGGCVIIILSLVIRFPWLLISLGVIVFIMVIIPILYSYAEFIKEKKISNGL